MTFFSIFSKKKAKSPASLSKEEIIIDSREKNSLVPSHLSSLGMKIKFEHLKVADYIVKDIAIERKTLSDFKSSIINKRIFSQLNELKQFPSYLLILENSKNDSAMHENAFRGFLLSVLLSYKIPVIQTKDSSETASYLSILAKKSKSNISTRASKILKTKKEQLLFILEGFPNIGPRTAEKLLKEFKTLKKITNASEEELKKAIGKKASSIYDLLN
jgi:ERCC4-type nuclease